MDRVSKLGLLGLLWGLVSGPPLGWALPQDVPADSIRLAASPSPVQAVLSPVQLTGSPGTGTRCYWLATEYVAGETDLSGPQCSTKVPSSLSSSVFVSLHWTGAAGATGYRVLKTTSSTKPTSGSVKLGDTTQTFLLDTGQSLTSWTTPSCYPAREFKIDFNAGNLELPAPSLSPACGNVQLGGNTTLDNLTVTGTCVGCVSGSTGPLSSTSYRVIKAECPSGSTTAQCQTGVASTIFAAAQIKDDGSSPTVFYKGVNLYTQGLYHNFTITTGHPTDGQAVCDDASGNATACGTSVTSGVQGAAKGTQTSPPCAADFSDCTQAVCFAGTCSFLFDGATTKGHYAVPSTTVAGDLHDAGASKPAGVQSFVIAQTIGAAGAATVNLLTPDTVATAAPSGDTGAVTSVSAGALSPLFTTSVATSTTTPALSFSLTNASGYSFFGKSTTGTGAPSYFTMGSLFGSACSGDWKALNFDGTGTFSCHTTPTPATGGPGTGFAHVQSPTGVACSACASQAIAFGSNTTAGNLLIVTVGGLWTSSSALTISDTASNTWTRADSQGSGTNSGLRIWYTCNAAGGADTVTIAGAPSGQQYEGLTVNAHEYSGNATTSCLDQAPVDSGNCGGGCPTTTTTQSITTTSSNELILAVINYDNRTGSGTSAPLATRTYTNGNVAGVGQGVLWDADLFAANVGSYSNTFTFGTGSNNDAYTRDILSFKSSSSVPNGTITYWRGTTGSVSGALTAGTCDSGTATVTGARTGMAVAASPNTYPGDGAVWNGYVSADNTVTVKECGLGTVTPTATTYAVRVFP